MLVSGTNLADTLGSTADSDVILGYEGNDTLYGFQGNDRLDGDQDADRLKGADRVPADTHPTTIGAMNSIRD